MRSNNIHGDLTVCHRLPDSELPVFEHVAPEVFADIGKVEPIDPLVRTVDAPSCNMHCHRGKALRYWCGGLPEVDWVQRDHLAMAILFDLTESSSVRIET